MDKEYFIVEAGRPKGPYTFEQLRELSIHPGTFIKHTGMDDYKEAHELEELRSLFGFKKIISAPQYFATLDVRLLAVVIDIFLVTFVYALIALVLVSMVDEREKQIAIAAAGIAVIPLIKLIYATVMESSPKQGTFGKSWIRIKVCDDEGGRLNTGKAFFRNLAKILSFATFGIGYLSGFFNRKQKCLHDIIAGTMVIKDRLI
ncbi:DUF4339 domain-containing protein [Pedobacter sp. HMF7647]|uniref:DUF4339 domain-containing protein n=1 Tax=Hufsiella arboris TaxID=2695275 RepID=A0A7K1Y8C2_9SPHI|nr:RDD family protein [Hufsiella arboris]MXV50826.1 DUF4339 domain-containing protein [Hufsiella arboris]